MSKVFITGATGQVGSSVADYLIKKKPLGIEKPADILCLTRNPEKALCLKKRGTEVVKGTLSDREILFNAVRNVAYVFHLAAEVFVYSSYEKMYKTNVEGTKNLLDAFVNSSASIFVYTSSIIVYNEKLAKSSNFEFTENAELGPCTPGSDVPYAVTKRLAEKLVNEYAFKHQTKTFIITRLSPIVGPGDRQMIPALVKSLKSPIPKLVNGGRGSIHLTAPEDVARAQVFLAERLRGPERKIFNVAHEVVSFKTLFEVISDYYNCSPPRVSIPLWLFKCVKPFLLFVKKFFPNNLFIQTFFSPSALQYLEKTYCYSSEKLKKLGFEYAFPIRDTILKALKEFDPDRKLVN